MKRRTARELAQRRSTAENRYFANALRDFLGKSPLYFDDDATETRRGTIKRAMPLAEREARRFYVVPYAYGVGGQTGDVRDGNRRVPRAVTS